MSDRTFVVPFKPREYQKPLIEFMLAGGKRAFAMWHRRAGKDFTMFNLMVRLAVERVGIYYYFLPTYSQGKKIIWDGMTNDGLRFVDCIPKEFVESMNSQELKITLKNGSLIQIIGTDRFDSVRGTNPVGCVFSEYAFQDPRAFAVVSPILRANGGWAIFNSCVVADTLILGRNGFERIGRNLPQGYTDINEDYFGLDNEFHTAEQYYVAGERNTLVITTKSGYEIECTPEHKLWNGHQWVRADKWKIGDSVAIQRGQNVFGDFVPDLPSLNEFRKSKNKDTDYEDGFSEDFFYEAGLILGDGYINYKGGYVVVTTNDKETVNFLLSRGYERDFDDLHYRKCSKYHVQKLQAIGFEKLLAKNKVIPEGVLSLSKRFQSAFISGYFDADGCADTRGRVLSSSASKKLTKDLQVILLNYGIVAKYQTGITPPTKKVKVSSRYYRLEIDGYSAYLFHEHIGFRLSRKSDRKVLLSESAMKYYGDVVKVNKSALFEAAKKTKDYYIKHQGNGVISYRKLKTLKTNEFDKVISDNFYYDEIVSISGSRNCVYDFVIPDTHSFFSNGFISHNTPNGKNHFYKMAQVAKDNPDWFYQKLTWRDTGFLTEDDIQKERDSGMLPAMIEQEYSCSFEVGAVGAYYVDQIQKMRVEDRICHVPYDPTKKVSVYTDIGKHDSSVFIFVQSNGKEIHVIDHMASNGKDVGEYVYMLNKRGYIYDTLWFPHDGEHKKFGMKRTVREQFQDAGFRTNYIRKGQSDKQEGIQVTRARFKDIWIDEKKNEDLILALENYQKEYDPIKKVFKDKPLHDWTSDYADAFRYMCIAHDPDRSERKSRSMSPLFQKRKPKGLRFSGRRFDKPWERKIKF